MLFISFPHAHVNQASSQQWIIIIIIIVQANNLRHKPQGL